MKGKSKMLNLNLRQFLILTLAFLLSACGKGKEAEQDRDLTYVQAYLSATYPELSTMSDLDKALFLRDLLHQRIQLGYGGPYDDSSWTALFRNAVVEQKTRYICGGIALLYGITAKAAGLQVRSVSLYNSITFEPGFSGHSVNEVFIEGRWIAIDATFNYSLKDAEGRYISFAEAREFGYVVDQGTALPGRSLAENGTPFETLLRYVYVFSSRISGPVIYPINWSGDYVVDAAGTTLNATTYDSPWSPYYATAH